MNGKEILTKKRLLLHCCCAPCASYVIQLLSPQYDCSAYFYNPNIEPTEEHDKREAEFGKLTGRYSLLQYRNALHGKYDSENILFNSTVEPVKDEVKSGKRCYVCVELRLDATANHAKKGEYDVFATTLTVSPHKNADVINEIGRKLGERINIEYLESDFKKLDGYARCVELSKEYDMYRQDYCGCLRSKQLKEAISNNKACLQPTVY
jgi:hypothetical protein